MQRIILLLALLILLSASVFAQPLTGSIVGEVIDEKTLEPLIGATIAVVGKTGIGTISDLNGNFTLKNLPVAGYSLRFSAVGYEPTVITDIVVSTGRSAKVKAKLAATAINREEMTVTTDYFRNGGTVGTMSSAVVEGSEVRRSPGAVMDMNRLVQIFPGVGNSQDQNNELIVRGGAPYENLTILDYIEIPSTNHYPNDFNSAGPINMVNSDMIEDLEFSTGGFPAQYGDKISSVMKVTLREGDRNVKFASNTQMHFAGVGTLMEGRLNQGQGSWMFSARQSVLEVFDKIVGASAIGLTAIPKYWDTQAKVVYDLTPRQILIWNGIYGNDRIEIAGDPKEKSDRYRNTTDSSSVVNVSFRSQQYATGITLKSLWGRKGYTTFTLSGIGNMYDIASINDFTARHFDNSGNVTDHTVLNRYPLFREVSDQSFVAAKFDWYWQPIAGHELSAGTQVQLSRRWANDDYFHADTSRYDLNHDGSFETGPIVTPEGNFHQRFTFGEANKSYVYLSDVFHATDRLKFTLGGRYDYFSYPDQGDVSPRFSAEYQLVPHTTMLNIAVGDYYQSQPFPEYGDRNNTGLNRYLKDMHARSYAAGFEQILGDGLKTTLEGYYKKYDKLAVSEQFIYSANDTVRSQKNLNVGRKTSYGLEFFLQQKQVKNFYGTLSVSWSKTRDEDPRQPQVVGEFLDTYDFPWIVVLSVGKITKDFCKKLDDMPFFIRYPSHVLPFSNDMEIGAKFRYQSGRPYTRREFVTWRQDREGGVQWSQGAWIDTPDINSQRYPDYQRLDLQWISRYHFTGWNLNTVVAIQNAYNHKNVFQYRYRSDGTIETEYQFAFFPILGVEAEF